MKSNSFGPVMALMIFTLLLTACGGGGGGGQVAGISGTGITASGTVSGFGSVIVNGVEFLINGNTQITVDGQLASEADLRVGQVVTVTGTRQTETQATADTVIADRLLDGPIEAIDEANQEITALDQTVIVNEGTVLPGSAGFNDLNEMNLIAVHGFVNANGEIVATWIQRASETFVYDGATSTDLEGAVSGLAPAQMRFNIDGLIVDFTNAMPDESAGALADGTRVEVFGSQTTASGVFTADSVRVINPLIGQPGRYVELEGLVTDFNGAGDFVVAGQPVNASTARQTDGTGQSLANGARVEVEGTINADRVLVAESFAIRPFGGTRMAATVGAVDVANDTFMILGLQATAEPTTSYMDSSVQNLRDFRLDDLRPGDYVEVRGFREGDGDFVATRIERRNPETSARIAGTINETDLPALQFEVAGAAVRIVDPAGTPDCEGNPLDINRLKSGARVEVEGTENPGEPVEILADEICMTNRD